MQGKFAAAASLPALLLAFTLCPPSASSQEAPAAPQAVTSFTISKALVAAGVDGREPVGPAESFPRATEKVYAFLEATDVASDTQVTFVWYVNGAEFHRYTLPLRTSPVWRTWAECYLYGQAGDWRVDILGAGGNTLKSLTFKVE